MLLDSENFPKIEKKRKKLGKNRKIEQKKQIEDSFISPCLTDRVGYTTGSSFLTSK